MNRLYKTAFFYLILGLVAGVFYREYTVLNQFQGKTELSVLHTHVLVLGFLFFLIVSLFSTQIDFTRIRGFNAWYVFYNIGLLFMVGMMVWIGMNQVQGVIMTGLNHMAGTAHIIFSLALIWFMVILGKGMNQSKQGA